jgi:hypothetical protein
MAASLAQLGLMLVLLSAAGFVARSGPRLPWLAARLSRRRARRLPAPTRRPLQVVAADLRRLTRQLSLVPAGAPLVRRHALLCAYDAVLIEAAEQLEVPHQMGVTSALGLAAADPFGPARVAERARVLGALEDAGLAVRA